MAGRTPISAGNWKMHRTNAEADALCAALAEIGAIDGVQVVLAPSFLQLGLVSKRFDGTGVGVAGQNMHFAAEGAYTGEVSASQLAEVANWVILRHSERRQYFCEDDSSLNRKVEAALAQGLEPILCVGERLEELEAGRTEAVLTRQVQDALKEIAIPTGFVVAYEPVWAIGTGVAASGEEAQAAASLIRELVAGLSDGATADSMRVLYGGSVKPENVTEYASQVDVDGALVGGAALDAESFLAITRGIAASATASAKG